jgi:TonB family protein
MFDPDSLIPKTDRLNFETGALRDLQEFRQRRKTAAAEQTASANSNVTREVAAKKRHDAKSKSSRSGSGNTTQNDLTAAGAAESIEPPPIQIEVVASNGHQILHPRNRSIELSMQGSPASHSSIYEALPMTGTAVEDAASVTSNAVQEVRVSVDSAEIIDSSAKLDYPLLARQMKIKGSVILEALIGRDGAIQDLDVVSGVPILADAAKAAVRQWHFKPHVRGDNTVETNAKIKVNFIISTY